MRWKLDLSAGVVAVLSGLVFGSLGGGVLGFFLGAAVLSNTRDAPPGVGIVLILTSAIGIVIGAALGVALFLFLAGWKSVFYPTIAALTVVVAILGIVAYGRNQRAQVDNARIVARGQAEYDARKAAEEAAKAEWVAKMGDLAYPGATVEYDLGGISMHTRDPMPKVLDYYREKCNTEPEDDRSGHDQVPVYWRFRPVRDGVRYLLRVYGDNTNPEHGPCGITIGPETAK
jgi:hypothetical protein